MQVHHSYYDYTTFTNAKEDAKRKGSDQTPSHISVGNGIQQWVYFDPSRRLFYGTDKPFTQIFLLPVVEFSSKGNLRFCRGKKD